MFNLNVTNWKQAVHTDMEMKPLLLLIAVFTSPLLSAQEGDASKLPPHLWLAETLKTEISWNELKQTLPGIGKPEHMIPSAQNLSSATDTFTLLDVPFSIRFEFDDDKLYGWGARASNLDHKTAIALADFLLMRFEERFGASVRDVSLPFETDGPRDEVSTSYLWHVNHQDFSLSLSLRSKSASVGFGASQTIMVGGNYYIADPQGPERGLLCGRPERNPQRVEIVVDPGAREKLHVLRKLHEHGVTGARPQRSRGLADYGQTLDLFGGKFTREKDGQRCFRLEWFRVVFPVTIWRQAVDGSRYAEVHFNMGSLFPDGIEFEGKPIDLSVFEEWSSSVRQRPKSTEREQ